MEIKKVLLKDIKPNESNPRSINDVAFKKLVQSIKDFPEMKDVREIVVNKELKILGGNMRYKAMIEAGITETTVKIVDWSIEKQKEFIIKDNIESGEWDYGVLANDWDKKQLNEWGLEFNWETMDPNKLDEEYSQKLGEVVYEPKQTNHKVSDIFKPEHKFDEEIEKIQNPELKELFKARVAYFHNFDYAKIADYYAYQATPEEKRMMEKLALVLLDKDKLIENGFSKIIESITDTNDTHENTDK